VPLKSGSIRTVLDVGCGVSYGKLWIASCLGTWWNLSVLAF
jgi:hypothetical protein